MTAARRRAAIQLIGAALALGACVASWLRSRSTVVVAPITSGQPSTTSITFYAPLLVLALMLLTAAGVLLVLAIATLRRRQPPAPREIEFPVAATES
jgi:hypothetical protein